MYRLPERTRSTATAGQRLQPARQQGQPVALNPARHRFNAKERTMQSSPSDPAAASNLSLSGNEPLFMVMNSGAGKHDATTIQHAIYTACGDAGRRCELILVDQGAGLQQAAKHAVQLAQQHAGIVVAVGGDGTLN